MTHVIADPRAEAQPAVETPMASQFVHFLMFKVDPMWRRLPAPERERGRLAFQEAFEDGDCSVGQTHAYSTLGLKSTADLLLWQKFASPEPLQETLSRALQTGLGQYLQVSHTLFGLTRPSVYTRRRTPQEQAIDERDRRRYLVVYPFAKSDAWYLMSQDARQGMMNEHMRIGHEFSDVRQMLLYATGLDDQEFVVAYETDDLSRHQKLVMALRATEGRKYTVRDTPIFTAIYRPFDVALSLLG